MSTHAGPRYRSRPWLARVTVDGRARYLGMYATRWAADEAEAAYRRLVAAAYPERAWMVERGAQRSDRVRLGLDRPGSGHHSTPTA